MQEEADWATAKRVLGQPKFIERLMMYDADNISDAILEALQRVVTDARFTADQVCLTKVVNLELRSMSKQVVRDRNFAPSHVSCSK